MIMTFINTYFLLFSKGKMKAMNQKKIAIDLNIRQATVTVPEEMNIVILWKRGTKKIDTGVK